MTPIQFDRDADTYPEALGISKERAKELGYQFQLLLHEFEKPRKKGSPKPSTDFFFAKHLELAEDEKERVYCAFIAGMKTREIIERPEYSMEKEEARFGF